MKNFFAALLHPVIYVLLFATIGASCAVGGVTVLAGPGWGLVVAGILSLLASVYITKGMTRG